MSSENGAQQSWQEKVASFCSAPTVEHEVGGQTIKFWPVSLRMLTELRSIGRPIAQALGAIMSGGQNDVSQEMTQSDDTTTDVVDDVDAQGNPIKRKVLVGVSGTNTRRDAVSVDLAEFRANQKERAIDRLIDAISDQNMLVLVKLIFDSCREIFPRNPSNDDLSEFVTEHANTVVVTQFVGGLMKANAQSLGKLGEQLTESVTRAVRSRISELDADGSTEPSPPETPTSSPTDAGSPPTSPPPAPTVVPPAPST